MNYFINCLGSGDISGETTKETLEERPNEFWERLSEEFLKKYGGIPDKFHDNLLKEFSAKFPKRS